MITPQPIRVNWTNYSNRVQSDALPADPDIVLVNPESFPVDVQADLILQAIGGTELLTYARQDAVNGEKILYQPLKDVNILATAFSPQSIIGSMPSWKTYRNSFTVQIDDKRIPDDPSLYGSVYVDSSVSGTGSNIVVELENLLDSDIIELAISTSVESNLFTNPLSIVDGGSSDMVYDGVIDGGNSLGYNIDISVDGGLSQ